MNKNPQQRNHDATVGAPSVQSTPIVLSNTPSASTPTAAAAAAVSSSSDIIAEEHSAADLENQIIDNYQQSMEAQEQRKLDNELNTILEEKVHVERQINAFPSSTLSPAQRQEKNRLVRRLVALERKEQNTLKQKYIQKEREKSQKVLMGLANRDEEADLVRRGVLTPFEAMQIRKNKAKTTSTTNRPPPRTTTVIRKPQRQNNPSHSHQLSRLNQFREREEQNAKRLMQHKAHAAPPKGVINQATSTTTASPASASRKRKRSNRYLKEGATLDDGDPEQFSKRMKLYHEEHDDDNDGITAEIFNSRFKVPAIIWDQLFDYQQTCVKWLWELHQQQVGGIIGDEMGLGKTVQISSFLGSLHNSGLFKPSLIMCPATVLSQWVRELHKWWPQFRVAMYHSSGSSEDQEQMVLDIVSSGNGILVTTYDAVRLNPRLLVKQDWGYVILDEGHRLKNPDSEITLTCKHFQTPHRLILTGTPIQNNLKELWSLFDFVYPGKLGTLPVFQSQFGVPISMGGYANASQAQVETAYQCAVTLRDLISPYLLRRIKKDVNHDLPQKEEKVLFCKLTDEQVFHYRQYLNSQEVQDALSGAQKVFQPVIQLRRICNHPRLASYPTKVSKPVPKKILADNLVDRSGKLKVVDHLLKAWKEDKHRVLLFSQSVKMLDILEEYLEEKEYNFRRMDGTTQIQQRMSLIDEFNNDKGIFVFLLTTKVGGIGVNLTGANRVILYDPDWNPSIDQQSLERCWRIGQDREVVVYRLMTQGTIEEKIYHRQIFKTFLTNKILSDPRQKRFFKQAQLYDLFTLGKEYDQGKNGKKKKKTFANDTETGQIFSMEIPTIEKRHQQKRIERTSHTEREKEEQEELYRVEDFMHDAEDDEHATQGDDKKETFVLQQLFNSESVGSVFDHDRIISKAAPEADIVEREASRIASMAAQKLLESAVECRDAASSYRPTWTGSSGVSGQPDQRFGRQASSIVQSIREEAVPGGLAAPMSSAALLGQIRGGPSSRIAPPSRNTTQRPPRSEDKKGKRLLRSLLTYLKNKGGRSSSHDLVTRFKSEAKGDDAVLFRCMLKEVAQFDKRGRSWSLKKEFR
uniref:DNA excision repair protein ERCC-6 n=1 Tax=Percolomonas cosmopolitus TaxID=63605 RepID=A0A7S1KSJ4_9EUKA|mmetsp:Transcript_7705/g.28893  ORF Transcript_7705/g.28893 Transcript_7705/m.28893 type:complete len:1088 (+) Transcript_7705:175-3438(+)|eukprot:CAMPEP_0117438232 /NCGR_PEP_ID=MMETSP0759-20121206/1946_1 /TAXON_ID=63605 /ORGANISM="Percolomonas cosmopolitus, Strain WS" /LENGTH=1087 /DNA_ID=CAMNT_0005229915 /DNA_START=143 /DNA_END=3406 /DNA_ORIENTATION=-